MIDEKEIMPFNFLKYGGVYSAGHNGMRYLIKREGDKPDFIIKAYVWQGPYCFSATPAEKISSQEFEYSEDGRLAAISWIKNQYETRKDEWDAAPSILDAPIKID